MDGLKIIVAAHKPYRMPEDACYLPLQVGAAERDVYLYIFYFLFPIRTLKNPFSELFLLVLQHINKIIKVMSIHRDITVTAQCPPRERGNGSVPVP